MTLIKKTVAIGISNTTDYKVAKTNPKECVYNEIVRDHSIGYLSLIEPAFVRPNDIQNGKNAAVDH